MKHYILAKFKDRSNTQRLLPEITELFRQTLAIEGVEKVEVHPSNSTRENRYSLMIVKRRSSRPVRQRRARARRSRYRRWKPSDWW